MRKRIPEFGMGGRRVAKGASGGNGARTLEKGLRLLELIARTDAPKPLSRLAAGSGLPPSTAHRLLSNLILHGFVEHDPVTRHYRLGTRMVLLSAQVLQQVDMVREATPLMRGFVDATGGDITLAVADHGEVAVLAKTEASGAPHLFLHLGRRAPMHCTALGKVLLAPLPDSAVLEILARRGMRRMTSRTIDSPRKFLAHLLDVRRRGYAVDDEETAAGARCLAVPVRNHLGKVVAALSTSGPVATWTPARMAALRQALRGTAHDLSERLGYRSA